jgi:hypothetical protein
MPGRRQTYTCSTPIDAAGSGSAVFTAPAGTLHVEHVRLTVSSSTAQPTATLYLNGADFEGSYSGANDQSDSAYDLQAQETLTCAWANADPGARATMTVRGTQED